jgi:uracil phosphoribosyltransferase
MEPSSFVQLYSKFSIQKRNNMVFVLTEQNSIANQFLLELRDKHIQQDRMRFRRNLERLGSIMAYEISKKLAYEKYPVESPLASTTVRVLQEQPVLVTILRAGLPFYQGFQNFFDHSDAGFIGAYRVEGEESISVRLNYLATPGIEGRQLILIDPMLATGRSVTDAVKALLKNGKPSHVHIASLVAAPEGLAFLKENLTLPFTQWTFAVDEKLNHQYYIVPGLGDAGDLSFGEKV